MAHQNVNLSNSNLSLERGFKNGKIKSLLKLPCSENIELASNFFGMTLWCAKQGDIHGVATFQLRGISRDTDQRLTV